MTEDDFITLVRDELGLPLANDELDSELDGVVSWDSLHILRLVAAVERETSRRIPIGRLLADRSLRAIYDRVNAAVAA
ncbi:MAG TPA: acyl carrier protein [Mycobacteriales bacterium]|nr:acyl carrier protein [Mycobacteriales bacterium]